VRTIYLDLLSGISGDMFVGGLLDLGASLATIETELGRLGLAGYHLDTRRDAKCGITGTRFEVHLDPPHASPAAAAAPPPGAAHRHSHGKTRSSHPEPHREHRTFREIRDRIRASGLSPWIRDRAIAVFERLARAEGKIHGQPPDHVHFHEVGALDSIVDIVSACIGLDHLGRPRVLAGRVIEGTGWLECAHGRLPIPAPATLELLAERGVTVSQCEEPHELVTPTGAALLAEFAETFGPAPALALERIGYGLGQRDLVTRPNVLRLWLGEAAAAPAGAGHDWEADTIAVLESNLDDVSGEILGHFVEQALAAGALDAFYTAVQMKKSRPGTVLTVLCAAGDAERFSEMILRETSAFGVRRTSAERRKLRREFQKVATPYGEVTVKVGWLDGRVLQAAPEFESCRAVALRESVPVKSVYAAALQALRG